MHRFLPWALATLAVLPKPADAIVFRSYDAARNKRFDPFPTSPQINPSQIFAGTDLTGIGWYSSSPDIQYALVSRQHVVFATHFASLGGTIRFLNASGGVFTRTQGTKTIIQDGGSDSDLTLVRLTTPLEAATGILPMAYLDLPAPADYEGLRIGVAGKRDESGSKFPVIGEGEIFDVETVSRTEDYGIAGMLTSRYLRFNYRFPPPGNLDGDDVYFEVGDSGSPSFVATPGGAALVGIHSTVDQPSPGADIENYDVFIPHYVAELDALLAADGFRMRPINAPATTLADSSITLPTTPRRALPLDFEYTLENTGGEETGNLEVEFQFDPAEAPDSLTPPAGWVSVGTGPAWTFRRALLGSGATATFTASWSAAPSVAEIDPGILRRSDTTAETAPGITIPLAPSFADWASGLTEAAPGDDPDGDTLPNLLEYALGGDPENGENRFEDGGRLTPQPGAAEGTWFISYPERTDKELRGLSYTVEFSTTVGGWSDTPPAGLSSTTESYVPDVSGFTKRVLSWTDPLPRRFARLRVELDE